MARLVSRAEFARIAGVSGAAITKACRPGGALESALDADRINADHKAARAYLASRGIEPAAPTRSRKPRALAPAAPPESEKAPQIAPAKPTQLPRSGGRSREIPIELTPEFPRYASLTLQQVIDRYGTQRAFRDTVEAVKKREEWRGRKNANDEAEGLLIPREFVKTHVFGAISASHTRLLRDAASTIAKRLQAAAKSGATVEELERTAREIISSILKPAMQAAERALRGTVDE